MKVAHLSDTHLGYAEYEVLDPGTGINARELDGYRSFEEACRAIQALRPDLLVHSGDLFDHPRPPNRAIVLALRQFAALAREGIPVVLVAGNHSLPSTRGTACILEGFEALGVHVACDSPRRFEIGPASILAIPHMKDEAALRLAFEEARPDSARRYNLLVLHAGLRGGPPREGNEALIPRELLKEKAGLFDYVALGHYHRHLRAAPMACYAGATERFQGDGSRGGKGFLIVEVDKREVRHQAVSTRPAAELGPIPCASLAPAEIHRRVAEASREIESGSILRITLEGLTAEACDGLDQAEMRKILRRMLHVEFRLRRRRGRKERAGTPFLAALSEQFEDFVSRRVEDAAARTEVLALARNYLERAREVDVE